MDDSGLLILQVRHASKDAHCEAAWLAECELKGDFSWRIRTSFVSAASHCEPRLRSCPRNLGLGAFLLGCEVFALQTDSSTPHFLNHALWQGALSACRENMEHATLRLQVGYSIWEFFSNSQKVNWCPPGTIICFMKTYFPWGEAKPKTNRLYMNFSLKSQRERIQVLRSETKTR